MRRRRLIVHGLLLLAVAGCARLTADPPAPPPGQTLDVIWVASDLAVVMEMPRAAEVGPHDVVYDLGCGDGRIVIAAAQRFGARAVGVDLDRDLLSEARQNAVKAGVSDRVTLREQDLFTTDLSQATVVTLYLSPEVNRRLRPKLLRELRPGSRIRLARVRSRRLAAGTAHRSAAGCSGAPCLPVAGSAALFARCQTGLVSRAPGHATVAGCLALRARRPGRNGHLHRPRLRRDARAHGGHRRPGAPAWAARAEGTFIGDALSCQWSGQHLEEASER